MLINWKGLFGNVVAAPTSATKLYIKVIQQPFSPTHSNILHIPPHSNEFVIPQCYWLLSDWTISWFPVYGGHCITTSPSSPATLLKVIFYTLGCSIMDDVVNILQVTAHARCYCGKDNTNNTIRNKEALKNDILVVRRCVCIENSKQTIITNVGRSRRIVGCISEFVMEMGIKFRTDWQYTRTLVARIVSLLNVETMGRKSMSTSVLS